MRLCSREHWKVFVCLYLLFSDVVSEAGGGQRLWRKWRKWRSICINMTAQVARPVNKKLRGSAVTFYCRCHDPTFSVQNKICLSWSLMSWISHIAPKKCFSALYLYFSRWLLKCLSQSKGWQPLSAHAITGLLIRGHKGQGRTRNSCIIMDDLTK